jgi:hypothetical protein
MEVKVGCLQIFMIRLEKVRNCVLWIHDKKSKNLHFPAQIIEEKVLFGNKKKNSRLLFFFNFVAPENLNERKKFRPADRMIKALIDWL